MALATVVETAGSTYRKPGAHMLIAADGAYAGLLSGGCLEGDLVERARAVIADGRTRLSSYDMRGPDDLLWGLGLGCEGAMQIALSRVSVAEHWQPLAWLAERIERHEAGVYALHFPATDANAADRAPSPPQFWRRGDISQSSAVAIERAAAEVLDGGRPRILRDVGEQQHALLAAVPLPPRVLILGGGPDAVPVTELGAQVGWQVSVTDHRPANARAERFPHAHRVHRLDADEVARQLDLNGYDALVIMSHHLPSDASYLRAAARSSVAYVGLLGPKPRREKLLADLGADAPALVARLRAPIGLDLGATTPETIALAIVAEIQAALSGRAAHSLSERSG